LDRTAAESPGVVDATRQAATATAATATAATAATAAGQAQRAHFALPREVFMSAPPVPLPNLAPAVSLVAWSGDASQLAALLNVPERELLAGLRRIGRQDKNRLIVNASPHNSGPILAALRRRLARSPAAE
jgi:hypothetical protein